jgi:23S rRNA (cytidine1920-2'-O)/16S rRNA (cytidine1409-2'-O)-methyltransferase
MRIDVYLAENGIVASRTEAKRFVDEGAVYVDGKQINKASYDVCGAENITVDKTVKEFVSRGGVKLKGALSEFGISAEGRLCLDVGASSGGFTDCLLKAGATHVIAVDSGSGQLAEALRRDSRVTVFENYNARYMKSDDFAYSPDLAVMDVSFISATYIIPSVYNVLKDGGEFVCLIKPQFEVGRSGLGKGGIVKDSKARDLAVKKVVDFAVTTGFSVKGTVQSSIKGGDGNIEFLAHFVKVKGVL